MKKIFLLIGLVLVVVSGVFAQVSVAGQTYYYRYVETVDPATGIRKEDNILKGGGTYITFTMNSCYTSDERGISKFAKLYIVQSPFLYQGEQNNLYVFMWQNSSGTTNFMRFSKDYKRMNYYFESLSSGVTIFERADPPKPDDGKGPQAPTQLW